MTKETTKASKEKYNKAKKNLKDFIEHICIIQGFCSSW